MSSNMGVKRYTDFVYLTPLFCFFIHKPSIDTRHNLIKLLTMTNPSSMELTEEGKNSQIERSNSSQTCKTSRIGRIDSPLSDLLHQSRTRAPAKIKSFHHFYQESNSYTKVHRSSLPGPSPPFHLYSTLRSSPA